MELLKNIQKTENSLDKAYGSEKTIITSTHRCLPTQLCRAGWGGGTAAEFVAPDQLLRTCQHQAVE